MKVSRRKEIIKFIEDSNTDLEIKICQYSNLVELLEAFCQIQSKNKEIEVAHSTPQLIAQKKESFAKLIAPYVGGNNGFDKTEANKFFSYWTEKSEKGRKMRFEKEPVFDVGRRVGTWMTNKLKFVKTGDDSRKTIDDIYNGILNIEQSSVKRIE
jgi:hypothetical protein